MIRSQPKPRIPEHLLIRYRVDYSTRIGGPLASIGTFRASTSLGAMFQAQHLLQRSGCTDVAEMQAHVQGGAA